MKIKFLLPLVLIYLSSCTLTWNGKRKIASELLLDRLMDLYEKYNPNKELNNIQIPSNRHIHITVHPHKEFIGEQIRKEKLEAFIFKNKKFKHIVLLEGSYHKPLDEHFFNPSDDLELVPNSADSDYIIASGGVINITSSSFKRIEKVIITGGYLTNCMKNTISNIVRDFNKSLYSEELNIFVITDLTIDDSGGYKADTRGRVNVENLIYGFSLTGAWGINSMANHFGSQIFFHSGNSHEERDLLLKNLLLKIYVNDKQQYFSSENKMKKKKVIINFVNSNDFKNTD